MNTMILIGLIAVIAVAGGAAVYVLTDDGNDNGDSGGESEFIHCQDMSDNWIDMPRDLESMYLCGAGTLRTISHLNLVDKICASDQLQRGATTGSNPYMYAFDEVFNDPSIKEHSDARMKVNLEKILVSNNGEKPQVLVIMDNVAAANADVVKSLKESGVVVFEMNYEGSLIGSDGNLDPLYEKQINRMGVAFDCKERADELLTGIKAIISDIKSMSTGTADVYVGGMTVQRTRGLGNTALQYPSILLTGTRNIADGHGLTSTGSYGQINISTEKLLEIIEDSGDFKMFVEPASWRLEKGLVAGDTVISAGLANKGVTKGMVITPVNSYGVDYDNVLVNGYLIAGHVNNIDHDTIRQKVDSVYELFYGEHAVSPDGVKIFDEMGEAYYGLTHCHFGENVTFSTDGIYMTDGTLMTA